MGIFSNFRERVAEKVQEMQEKQAFLREVEDEAKPIRRAAYLKQIKDNAVTEGRLLAQKALDKKMKPLREQPKTNTPENDKIVEENWGMSDPLKYLNKQDKKNGN